MTRWRRWPATPARARSAVGSASWPPSAWRPAPMPARSRGWPRARKAGVLVRPLLGGVAVSPPLICEQDHIDLLAQAIEAGLDDVAAG